MIQQVITPFKCTAEDLDGLDKKTRDGMAPLLDDLNVFANQVVAAQQATPSDDVVQLTLNVGAAIADSFPLVFRTSVTQPRVVVLGNIVPRDTTHSLVTPFVMQGFSITDQGLISIPLITGLRHDNEYALTFWVR